MKQSKVKYDIDHCKLIDIRIIAIKNLNDDMLVNFDKIMDFTWQAKYISRTMINLATECL